MRLAEFILHEIETILMEWEGFALTLAPAAESMTSLALRNHAQQILEAVAADISSPQTKQAQSDKSKGNAPRILGASETAAQTHAILRAQSGFDIKQLVAEYRALRACVLRLWMDASQPNDASLNDVIRFNEAIDQAIAESVSFFAAQVEQARNLLLGMLGHDLRSPLATIMMTGWYLADLNAGEEVSEAASCLIQSGDSMQALLDDLVDFNRAKLGLGITVRLADIDVANILGDELKQLRRAHPDRRLELTAAGETRGRWDGLRLQQVLRNLVSNAIKYGAPEAPVRVAITGEESAVRIEVVNSGPAIDPALWEVIFDPLRQGMVKDDHLKADGGFGLGLYIVREVARSHGGEVAVRSDETGTVFTVQLPRAE
jgi:hypothetical protein